MLLKLEPASELSPGPVETLIVGPALRVSDAGGSGLETEFAFLTNSLVLLLLVAVV